MTVTEIENLLVAYEQGHITKATLTACLANAKGNKVVVVKSTTQRVLGFGKFLLWSAIGVFVVASPLLLALSVATTHH